MVLLSFNSLSRMALATIHFVSYSARPLSLKRLYSSQAASSVFIYTFHAAKILSFCFIFLQIQEHILYRLNNNNSLYGFVHEVLQYCLTLHDKTFLSPRI